MTSAREWVCTLKTTGSMLSTLTSALREAHSYEVPEIVVTELSGGDQDYLAWIRSETGG